MIYYCCVVLSTWQLPFFVLAVALLNGALTAVHRSYTHCITWNDPVATDRINRAALGATTSTCSAGTGAGAGSSDSTSSSYSSSKTLQALDPLLLQMLQTLVQRLGYVVPRLEVTEDIIVYAYTRSNVLYVMYVMYVSRLRLCRNGVTYGALRTQEFPASPLGLHFCGQQL